MDASNISSLITALRNETEKNSITPESIGYLLQKVLDFCHGNNVSLEDAMSQLISEISRLDAKNDVQDAKAFDNEAAITALESQLSKACQSFDTKDSEHDNAIASIRQTQSNHEVLIEEAKGNFETALATVQTNSSSISNLQKDVSGLLSEVATVAQHVRDNFDQHEFDIDEVNAQALALGKRVETVEQQSGDNYREIGLLGDKSDALELRIDACEDKGVSHDEEIAGLKTTDATLTAWGRGHGIVNLHQFIAEAEVESSVFPEYMQHVPELLRRDGLVVMINTPTGWEAWRLVDAEEYTSTDAYKRLDWDNSQLSGQVAMLREDHNSAYNEITANYDEFAVFQNEQEKLNQLQSAFNLQTENHISQTENDYIGVAHANGEGTLFEQVIDIKARLAQLEQVVDSILAVMPSSE